MLFNSLQFLVFFPVVAVCCFLLPLRLRNLFLLLASYYFYMCWNPAYALLMAFSSFVTWLSGILIAKTRSRHPERAGAGKLWVALSLAGNLSILFFFKYFNFIVTDVLGAPSAVRLSVLLPVGISFYTFQALGYTLDVYRGDVAVEYDPLRYFVFVAFFPQLVAGPIERSSNLLGQLREKHDFQPDQARDGLLLMLWGYFQKLVIADRLAICVSHVFVHYSAYSGVQLFVAAVFFAFELYCDFAGYSNIAVGAAQVMGFRLTQNFHAPYFSRSVAEFWRRWHVSLSSWFRDYLYIPLGGSRCGRARRYFNLMVVFLAGGLWHGAGWNYILWGGLNGAFQVVGVELRPLRERLLRAAHVHTESFGHKLLQVIVTFLLIDFTWVFFCAADVRTAFDYLARMATTFELAAFFDGSLFQMRLSRPEFGVAVAAICVLLGVDAMHYRGWHLRQALARQGVFLRCLVYLLSVYAVLIFGVYGPGFDARQFIYFQF